MNLKKYRWLFIVFILILVIILLLTPLIITSTRSASYNSILKTESNSINSYNENFTLYYRGNFASNQPLFYPLNAYFNVPFNYTIYREGNKNSTALSIYYNVGELFALENIESNTTLVNLLKQYTDEGNFVGYNISELTYLENKYNLYSPLSEISFTNASGFYICSANPVINKNATLGVFSCGLVSSSESEGLKYMIYNLSQITAYSVGFDMNQLNLTVRYIGSSTFLNQTCSKYSLYSKVESNLISILYTNYSADINGTECISNKLNLPLYEYINATIPLKDVYSFFNLTLVNLSNSVSSSITSFPKNHALNLTYSSIS